MATSRPCIFYTFRKLFKAGTPIWRSCIEAAQPFKRGFDHYHRCFALFSDNANSLQYAQVCADRARGIHGGSPCARPGFALSNLMI